MTPTPRDVPFAHLPGGLAPLGYRNYLLYWVGFVVSNSGRWMELTGAVWLLSELTPDPWLLGIVGLFRALPQLVLGPFAGVVADRVDQRKLLVATQAASVVASFGLGALILMGHVEIWQVYLQVGMQSAISAFDATVRQALFPRLVPREHLAEAVTLHSTAVRVCQLIGPALGGLVIAALGEAAPFLVNGGSSFVLIGAALAIRGVTPRRPAQGSTLGLEFREGLRYILATPVIGGLARLELVFGLLSMNPVMTTIYGRQVLGVGPEGLGGLLSAEAVGALVGVGVILSFGQRDRQGRFIVMCQLIYSALLVAMALTAEYVLCFAALAALGLFDTLTSVTRQNVVQLVAPGRMRGRVMANIGTITRASGPFSQTLSGALASAFGPRLAIVASAATLSVAAALVGRRNTTLWRIRHEDLVRRATPNRPSDAAEPVPVGDPPA